MSEPKLDFRIPSAEGLYRLLSEMVEREPMIIYQLAQTGRDVTSLTQDKDDPVTIDADSAFGMAQFALLGIMLMTPKAIEVMARRGKREVN
jgi:hypothetical protein